MSETEKREWAAPDTLLGLLQRGRGAGYLEALNSREEAAQAVIGCIAHDPRWDHQVESRAWFYASLVAELGIDLSHLRVAFDAPVDSWGDDAAWIAVGVFELSARRGIPGAVDELRRYLRSGRDVELALQHLLPLVGHPEAVGLLDDIVEFANVDQIRDTLWSVDDFTVAPWPEWRRANRDIDQAIVASLSQRGTTRRPPGTAEERARETVLKAASEAPPGSPLARLTALADGNDDVLLEVAPALFEDDNLRPAGVHRGVRRLLWALTSPRALAWARSTASRETETGWTALALLSKLAEPSDLTRLHQFLDDEMRRSEPNVYTQSFLVEALERLRDEASVPAIEKLFDSTLYSYLRRRCAEALNVIPCDFRERKAFECLWDCESETRMLGVRTVDTNLASVSQRLADIAGDPTEDEECRQAATDVTGSAP